MARNKNIYSDSLKIIKHNIGSSIATVFFLTSCVVLFYLIEKVLFSQSYQSFYSDFKLNLDIIWIIFAALIFIVLSPLELGVKKWFYETSCERKSEINQIFFYFSSAKKYFSAIAVKLNIAIRLALIYSLVIMPAVLIWFLVNYPVLRYATPVDSTYLFVIAMLIISMFLGSICAVHFSLKYFLAYYLFFENGDKNIISSVRKSKKLMRGRKSEVLTLYIMILPFFALGILIVPLVFILPYTYILTSLKAKRLIAEND